MKITTKLLLMAIVPIVGLFYLSSIHTIENYKIVHELNSLQSLSELGIASSLLVHELQKERGVSSGYIGGEGKKFNEELHRQWDLTDKKIQALKSFVNLYKKNNISNELSSVIDHGIDRLSVIEDKRKSIKSLDSSMSDVIEYYTKLNSSFIKIITYMKSARRDVNVYSTLAAYINLIQAKEIAGLERAILSNASAQGYFVDNTFNRFVSLLATQDAYIDVFISFASDDQKSFYNDEMKGVYVNEVNRLREITIKNRGAELEFSHKYWFDMMTGRINQLKKVEDNISKQLREEIVLLRSAAQFTFVFHLILICIVVGVTLFFHLFFGKSITRPLRNLVSITNKISNGERYLKIEEVSNDEIGEVSVSVKSMLKSINETEKSLKESEARYRRLVELSPNAIIVICDGKIVFINPAGIRLLGANSDVQVVGKLVMDFVHPDYREYAQKRLKKITQENIIAPLAEAKFIRLDGSGVDVEVTGSLLSFQGGPSVQIVVQDISERKQAEEALNKRIELTEKLVSESPIGIAIYDEAGQCISANDACAKIVGATNEQVLAQNYHEIESWKKSGLYEKVKYALSQSRKIQHEINVESTFGAQVMLESFLVPFGNGKLFLMIIDHTEREHLETQLRQAQKMEAIGVLTGGIAHEFNNLLTPILGYAEMLIKKHTEDDPDNGFLRHIQIAANRAKKLVQQMLAYGRKSTSQKESIQIESLVEEVIDFIKNTTPSNISIIKEIEINLPAVFGVPDEIRQILLNLCINAIHAMPDGGDLILNVCENNTCCFINSEGKKLDGDFICLCVKDAGIGINQDILEKIYDPFFSTKEVGEGSGLGLSVVSGIVEQHGGYIEVESKEGEGTVFGVYFPVSKKEVKRPVSQPKNLSYGNEQILLIDNDQTVLHVTKYMLEELGYKVTEFLDCSTALKFLNIDPEAMDLIITEYGMAEMNGKLLASKAKEIRKNIPVILLTGYGGLVAKEDVKTWGMEDILIKPIELKELSRAVREAIDKSLIE